ncbi:hypothetical protein EPO15_14950 [bacterium]|nr:MAG: hypothetical protein EPO15_14950 [bacterium]
MLRCAARGGCQELGLVGHPGQVWILAPPTAAGVADTPETRRNPGIALLAQAVYPYPIRVRGTVISLALAAWAVVFARPSDAAGTPVDASVAGASGLVQVRGDGPAGGQWQTVEKTPSALRGGTALRTGRRSTAFLRLGTGVTALLQEDTVVTLEDLRADRLLVRLDVGVAAVRTPRGGARLIQFRTPAAALTARGAEFRLTVLSGGRTAVELSDGELGVEDNRGHQLLLRAGESVSVDLRGLEVPRRMPAAAALRREGLKELVRREAAADSFKERLYAAAAEGARRAEWQEGRALIGSDGRRVRVETWLRRPRADQLEFVTLNAREGGSGYHYFLGTFDAGVGDDVSAALRGLSGTAGAAPGRTLTAYESVRSNGADVVMESADGGHLVDLNANADGTDDVSAVFDPVSGGFRDAAGTAAWRSLFDRWGLYLNGRLAGGWTGNNIQKSADTTPSTTNDPFSNAALTAANALLDGGNLATRSVSVTHPQPGLLRQSWAWSFSDGTSLGFASTALAGGAAAPGVVPGVGGAAAFRRALPGTALEQSVSSSLFSGRRIELFLDPALALPTGLVP